MTFVLSRCREPSDEPGVGRNTGHRAYDCAVSFIRSEQLPSGAWISDEYFEPRTSSVHLITLAFIKRLPEVEARAYARFPATTQLPNGAFPPYPFAPHGELCATALTYAALQADHDAILRGQRLFKRHSWLTSIALLSSSLPQSYAAADGAGLGAGARYDAKSPPAHFDHRAFFV